MPQKCFSISCVSRTAAVPAVFSVFSDFLCTLCVNVLAFLRAQSQTLTTSAPPKIAPTASAALPAPHKTPVPSKPSSPAPPQYPEKLPAHAARDKSPSFAPDPYRQFFPAPRTIPPRPECRPPPETPSRYSPPNASSRVMSPRSAPPAIPPATMEARINAAVFDR